MELKLHEDGNHSVNFTSTGELSVLVTGLKVACDTLSKNPNHSGRLIRQAGIMTRIATDISAVHDRLAGSPFTQEVVDSDHPMQLEFTDPHHVQLAELAVRIMASSDPAENDNPDLQDPLKYQFAQDMGFDYSEAADAADILIPGYNAPAE
jgi:hypothetical protein